MWPGGGPRGLRPRGQPDSGFPSPTRRGATCCTAGPRCPAHGPWLQVPEDAGHLPPRSLSRLQLGLTPWLESQAVLGYRNPRCLAGYTWHGAHSQLSALRLSWGKHLWRCRLREPREPGGSPCPGLDGPPSWGAAPLGVLRVSGRGQRQEASAAAGPRPAHAVLTQQERLEAVGSRARVPARAQSSNLCCRRGTRPANEAPGPPPWPPERSGR